MNKLFVFVLLLFLFALPVRLAAYWFNAERGTWLRSIGVLFLSAFFINIILAVLPISLAGNGFVKFLVSLLFLTFFSSSILGVKAWQALVLALFLATFYSLGDGPAGVMSVSAGFSI